MTNPKYARAFGGNPSNLPFYVCVCVIPQKEHGGIFHDQTDFARNSPTKKQSDLVTYHQF